MLSKSIAFALIALIGASTAQYHGYHNNIVEFDVPIHIRNGIGVPSSYQEVRPVFGPLQVPAPTPASGPITSVVASKLGLIGSIVSHVTSIIHSAISCVITSIPAIIVGVLTSLGLCKLTPLCNKLSAFRSIKEVGEEFRSFATPERITRAAMFVEEAIKKYSNMN